MSHISWQENQTMLSEFKEWEGTVEGGNCQDLHEICCLFYPRFKGVKRNSIFQEICFINTTCKKSLPQSAFLQDHCVFSSPFHPLRIWFLDETPVPLTAFIGFLLFLFCFVLVLCPGPHTRCGTKGAAGRSLGHLLPGGREAALQSGHQGTQPWDRSVLPTYIALPDRTWNTFLLAWECQDVYGHENIKRSQALVQGLSDSDVMYVVH